MQVTRKDKSNIRSGLVISNCNHVWWWVGLHTPKNIPNTSPQFCQKKQLFHQNVYPWLETNERVWFLLLRDASELKTMTLKSIKTLLTNCPQICQIMEVTKCFAASIAINKDLLCYTTQPEQTAYDPKCSHILQSDMKETVVNYLLLGLKKKMPFLQREPEESVSKNRNHIPLALLNPVKISCRI